MNRNHCCRFLTLQGTDTNKNTYKNYYTFMHIYSFKLHSKYIHMNSALELNSDSDKIDILMLFLSFPTLHLLWKAVPL